MSDKGRVKLPVQQFSRQC